MPSTPTHVFVVCETTASGDMNLVEAHTTSKGALAAASKLGSFAEVKDLELKKAKKEGEASGGKAKAPKKSANNDDGEDELADDNVAVSVTDDWEEDAVPGALRGLKLLFTGTLGKKRTECEEIAEKYGAEIVKKLEEVDYVVLGTKPGPAKVKTINSLRLETIDEEEFRNMLEEGVPQEKRERMAVAAAAAKEAAAPPAKKRKG